MRFVYIETFRKIMGCGQTYSDCIGWLIVLYLITGPLFSQSAIIAPNKPIAAMPSMSMPTLDAMLSPVAVGEAEVVSPVLLALP